MLHRLRCVRLRHHYKLLAGHLLAGHYCCSSSIDSERISHEAPMFRLIIPLATAVPAFATLVFPMTRGRGVLTDNGRDVMSVRRAAG